MHAQLDSVIHTNQSPVNNNYLALAKTTTLCKHLHLGWACRRVGWWVMDGWRIVQGIDNGGKNELCGLSKKSPSLLRFTLACIGHTRTHGQTWEWFAYHSTLFKKKKKLILILCLKAQVCEAPTASHREPLSCRNSVYILCACDRRRKERRGRRGTNYNV